MEIAIVLAVIAVIFIMRTIKIVPQQNAWVVERLGKYDRTLTPGLKFVIPFIERVAYKHSLKEVPLDVPSQVCITKDNTQLQVDGILYFQVTDPMRASYGSSNYMIAITQLAQTTLRSVIGKMELDKTFEERDLINASVVNALDEAALNWGVKVLRYEIKDLTPPAAILHAMQAQITAEREKRALIAASEGRRQEQINIATGEREAFIARSEGEKQAEINKAAGQAAAIIAVADATADAIRKIAAAIQEPGGDAGRAAEGGREGRRGLCAAGAEEQHDDRAGQHDRGVGADRHRDGADQERRRAWRHEPEVTAALNVLGTPLVPCSYDPLTGWYRDGCCHTDEHDAGSHVICAKVTVEFLNFQMERGNDLITPRPEHRFKGLKPGDRWCVCALRWREAYEAGCAPPVVLESTHARALEYVLMDWLRKNAVAPVG